MTAAGSINAAGPAAGPAAFEHVITFRVRYSETDQMGTFYNSRPLEWFYTLHAFTDRNGRVIRPPAWFIEGWEMAKNVKQS